jgi:hypothetical protein
LLPESDPAAKGTASAPLYNPARGESPNCPAIKTGIFKMAALSYRIRIVREGLEFEIEGDKRFVLDVLARLEPSSKLAKPPTKGNAGTGSSEKANILSSTKGKAISIREFIQQLEFKKHTDITLAFGYYLEHFSDTPEFTPADINNCYYEAKIDSSNTSQMIILNIRRGYLMPSKAKADGGKKRYTLTNTGEKFIQAALSSGS